MDKINKALAKVPLKQRIAIDEANDAIKANKLKGLDIKKVKGSNNIYRVRVGRYRIVFQNAGEQNIILQVAKRDEQTYKDF
ncbi:MAG: type II toxin-antitoxin system RelE family toxin [Candidatus Saccharimonadales bacterium]